jgi:hypothetical protein
MHAYSYDCHHFRAELLASSVSDQIINIFRTKATTIDSKELEFSQIFSFTYCAAWTRVLNSFTSYLCLIAALIIVYKCKKSCIELSALIDKQILSSKSDHDKIFNVFLGLFIAQSFVLALFIFYTFVIQLN